MLKENIIKENNELIDFNEKDLEKIRHKYDFWKMLKRRRKEKAVPWAKAEYGKHSC